MSKHSNDANSYDYIICGGGTSGCVIAGRLAEQSSATILLIEAGPPRESVTASAIPAGVSQILGTDADWNIQSEPCAQLNHRRLHLGRGKFLGGSSGTNAALCIRGVKQDYNDWNMDGWGGEEMFQYMKRVETFQVTAPHEPAPISRLVMESLQSKGFPLHDDMFTSGKYSKGCGHTVRTIHEGKRTCSTDYLKSDASQSKVTVMTGRYMARLIIEKVEEGHTMIATGVQVQDDIGNIKTYHATKEIILAAGAYGSPAILLRSGIGPADELNALNIPSVLNLPGVGKNLMDHLVMLNLYEVSKPGLTNDHLIWHTGAREKSMQEYKNSRTGKTDDPMAVVDGDLRVKAIQGLRVADASIMPTLNSGHPQMVVYAIGEKAVDLLLSD